MQTETCSYCPTVIVAGNINLDIIPSFQHMNVNPLALFSPGKLINIGHAITSTGGSVSNTGIALHRLGIPTRLVARIGNDSFGQLITELIRSHSAQLAKGLIQSPNESTSYTFVINLPTVDRMFLHYPGANDYFSRNDIPWEQLEQCRLLHFGYPPLMKSIYSDGGKELEFIFSQLKIRGLSTSLDMAKPDPESEAGKVNWRKWLERVLPHTDVFLPSFEEILFMLNQNMYQDLERAYGSGNMVAHVNTSLFHELCTQLLDMGVAIAGLKLGDQGLYVKTTNNLSRLSRMGHCTPVDLDSWLDRELLTPCFQVHVAGTTGAGDCTIAGFLVGLTQGYPLEDLLTHAVAVGAHNVEQLDAISGIPTIDQVRSRIASNWSKLPIGLKLDDWNWLDRYKMWSGKP